MESQDPDDPGLTTREAFDLISDETRAEILRVLNAARQGELPPALSFSELRDRIEVDTRSSQFNYHLDRLVGTFVEDRSVASAQPVETFAEDDEGYALSPTGTFLTRVVTAMGTDPAAAPARVAPFTTDMGCHFCESSLEAGYRNRTFHLQCPGCDHLYAYTLTPPGLVADDPDPAELLARADRYLRQKYTTFARGSCPLCANSVAPDLISPAAINWPGAHRLETLVRRVCSHCGNTNYAVVGTELLRDPALIAFCRQHGRDVVEPLLWELPFAITDRRTEVLSEDPWQAELSVPAGDATLAVTVDETLTVVDRTRT